MKTQSMEESKDRLDKHLDTIAPPEEGAGGTPPAPAAEVPPTEPQVVPPQETPPVAEETPPAETPPQEAPSPEEGASVFDMAVLNERFGTDFADEETFKSSLNRLNDLSEFDTLKTEREESKGKMTDLEAKYTEAKDLLNPRQYFNSEEEYKRQQILMQHGQELNPAVLNKIVSADFSTMNDVEVLILGKQVANPNIIGGEAGAREMIYQQLGVDPEEDPKDWTPLTRNTVAENALAMRKELSKIKDVEVPEAVDFETQRATRIKQAAQEKEKLKTSWTEVAKEMVNNFNNLDLSRKREDGQSEVYFSYEIDPEFKAAATDMVVGYLVDNNKEPSKESIQEAEHYVQDLFWRKNGNAIAQAYGKDVEAKLIEKHNIADDNPKPPNEQEAPEDDASKRNAELADYVKEPWGKDRPPGAKLFG